MAIRLIITHPGGSHKDDLLACSVLAHVHQVPIERRDPTEDELVDPGVCVVDIGGQHEPELNNFDHHQFPRDHPPTCALSLVLQHIGLYEDARLFCDWLEVAEWFDSRGPVETARWMGVERGVIDQLNSPVDVTLLRRFARSEKLDFGDPIWQMMQFVGEDLIAYLKTLRGRLEFIRKHSEWWDISEGKGFKVLFMPRTDPLPAEPSMGMPRFVEAEGQSDQVAALVYPDRRGDGFALSRFNDDPRLDFSQVENQPDTVFAHARGFVAKTQATEPGRLRELLTQAVVN